MVSIMPDNNVHLCYFLMLKIQQKFTRVDKIERWHTLTPASGTTGHSGTPGRHIAENAMIQLHVAKPDINSNRESRSKRKDVS